MFPAGKSSRRQEPAVQEAGRLFSIMYLFIFMCMSLLPACVYIHHVCIVPTEASTGLTDDEPPYGQNPCSLQEQLML